MYGGQYSQAMNPDDHGTSHLSVVDAERRAVAMTTTINTGFGSKVISNSTGLLTSVVLWHCMLLESVLPVTLELPLHREHRIVQQALLLKNHHGMALSGLQCCVPCCNVISCFCDTDESHKHGLDVLADPLCLKSH